MYCARHCGNERCRLYSDELLESSQRVLQLENDIRLSVEHGDFQLAFQPILSLTDEKPVALEALLRWPDPFTGPSNEFLSVAEEAGLMTPIGWWVIEHACRQLVRIWKSRLGSDPLTVTVNITPSHLACDDFVDRTLEIVRSTGLDPRCLAIEVTENTVINDIDLFSTRLTALKSHGIRLYMDDFGTGYSSLSYLRRLPYDVLKIDRSFLLSNTDEDWHVVQSIIALAHSLGMDVLAEGIESKAQADRLKSLNCTLAQGFFYARPMSGEAVLDWLADHASPMQNNPQPLHASSEQQRESAN